MAATSSEREIYQRTKYSRFKLKSNPFPKSGTANIHESTERTYALAPFDNKVMDEIEKYVLDSLYSDDDTEDFKLAGTVTGDYGTGKTQLLLYARALILKENKRAFALYINNPGVKISELIGSIIENVGREDLKKFLWRQIIDSIEKEEIYRNRLISFLGIPLFPIDPFTEDSKASYKAFLEFFLKNINDKRKTKEFQDVLKQISREILYKINNDDNVVADYFFNIIAEDVGISRSWEELISGDGSYLDKKSVQLLNAIITIVQEQGFERFYLLVDEFEDITSSRLSKKEQDNYTRNLRTLLDRERRWCLLLAMTTKALDDIAALSPPLYDRLTDRKILIKRLTLEQAKELMIKYLNLSREDSNRALFPFCDEAVEVLFKESQELPRVFLRNSYYILERALSELPESEIITADFVTTQLNH